MIPYFVSINQIRKHSILYCWVTLPTLQLFNTHTSCLSTKLTIGYEIWITFSRPGTYSYSNCRPIYMDLNINRIFNMANAQVATIALLHIPVTTYWIVLLKQNHADLQFCLCEHMPHWKTQILRYWWWQDSNLFSSVRQWRGNGAWVTSVLIKRERFLSCATKRTLSWKELSSMMTSYLR